MPSIKAIRETSGSAEQREPIGANSAAIVTGDLVTIAGGFASKATTTGILSGSALKDVTFASDNQTVAQATLPVRVFSPHTRLILACSSSSLAKTDEGKFFNLTSGQVVDYATAGTTAQVVNTSDAGSATDPVITKQLKLVRYIGQNTSEYAVVNFGNL